MKSHSFYFILLLTLTAFWSCSKKSPSGPGGGSGGGGGGGSGGGTAVITVVSPDGGERWNKGSKRTITWTASGLSAGVLRVDFSKDGGSTWTTLDAGLALSVRSHSWVPEDTTSRGLIKVANVNGSQTVAKDSSDAVFAVPWVGDIPYAVNTVVVDASPYGVAITPDGNYAYVTCAGAGLADVIATTNDSVVARIMVGSQPQGITIASNGLAYVANLSSNSVSVISTSSRTVVNTITGYLSAPSGVATSGQYVFTVSPTSNQLAIYDTLTRSIFYRSLPAGGVGIAASSSKVYATSFSANAVIELDIASLVTTPHYLATGRGPSGIAIRAGESELYVADAQSNHGSALSLPGWAETPVSLREMPTGMAVKPTGNYAYVSQNTGSSISAINTASKAVTGPIAVGSGPVGLAVTPSGKHVYVANATANTVSVVYTNGF